MTVIFLSLIYAIDIWKQLSLRNLPPKKRVIFAKSKLYQNPPLLTSLLLAFPCSSFRGIPLFLGERKPLEVSLPVSCLLQPHLRPLLWAFHHSALSFLILTKLPLPQGLPHAVPVVWDTFPLTVGQLLFLQILAPVPFSQRSLPWPS